MARMSGLRLTNGNKVVAYMVPHGSIFRIWYAINGHINFSLPAHEAPMDDLPPHYQEQWREWQNFARGLEG